MKNKILRLILFGGVISFTISAYAEYKLIDTKEFKLGIGGYARIYSGKLESNQYNTVLKAEPRITTAYKISNDLTIKGNLSYRIVRNDRFSDKKVSKFYDAYGTILFEDYGSIDVGKLRSVGYNLHAGSVDVSPLDIIDSDISFFYKDPKISMLLN